MQNPAANKQSPTVELLPKLLADLNWIRSVPDSTETELEREIRKAIEGLPAIERLVLKAYYADEQSIDEICRLLGLSAARVHLARRRAINRLRTSLEVGLIAREESPANVEAEHRYTQLVGKKYLEGLSDAEKSEMDSLFVELSKQDNSFYAPVLGKLRQSKRKVS